VIAQTASSEIAQEANRPDGNLASFRRRIVAKGLQEIAREERDMVAV